MSDDRLMRALGAAAAPKRDPGFVLAVLAQAERRRYRADSAAALFRAAGLAAAGGALVIMLGGWVGTHPEATQTVVLAAGGLLGLMATTRMLARLSPASR